MSSLKEQRDKIFQEKLQELGDMGTKERTLEDAPFYDKPVTSLALPPKEKKEEEITSESTSTISFSQYADLYLTAIVPKVRNRDSPFAQRCCKHFDTC